MKNSQSVIYYLQQGAIREYYVQLPTCLCWNGLTESLAVFNRISSKTHLFVSEHCFHRVQHQILWPLTPAETRPLSSHCRWASGGTLGREGPPAGLHTLDLYALVCATHDRKQQRNFACSALETCCSFRSEQEHKAAVRVHVTPSALPADTKLDTHFHFPVFVSSGQLTSFYQISNWNGSIKILREP